MIGEGDAAPNAQLQKLCEAIDAYEPDVCGKELVLFRQALDRAELKFARAAGEFAETDEWRDGSSPIEYLRYEAKMASGVAADRIEVGRQWQHLSRSIEAVKAGEIGFAHLALMARTAESLLRRDRRFAEAALLDKAREQSVTRFRRTCESTTGIGRTSRTSRARSRMLTGTASLS